MPPTDFDINRRDYDISWNLLLLHGLGSSRFMTYRGGDTARDPSTVRRSYQPGDQTPGNTVHLEQSLRGTSWCWCLCRRINNHFRRESVVRLVPAFSHVVQFEQLQVPKDLCVHAQWVRVRASKFISGCIISAFVRHPRNPLASFYVDS